MKKSRNIEVTKSRYRHPGKDISQFSEKLEKSVGFDGASDNPGLDLEQDFGGTGDSVGDPEFPQSQPPPVIFYDPDTMTIDSVFPGQTVEEILVREGDIFKTSIPFDFFRNVWFDALEAYYIEHWTISGNNYLIPNAVLLSDTEVIGRYVVV